MLSLDEALEKARIVYKYEKRNAASPEVIISHWGYGPKSSTGRSCIATLKKFGLLEEAGNGGVRLLRLSRLAMDILLQDEAEHHEQQLKAIREAALLPHIHSELWEKWEAELPSDSSIRAHLIREKNFNDSYVSSFIKHYKRTLSFAKLYGSESSAVRRSSVVIDSGDDDETEPIPMTSTAPIARGPSVHRIPATYQTQVEMPTDLPPLAASDSVHVLRIPLDDNGKTFDVRFPMGLSKEDFDFAVENIKLWAQRIVAKSKPKSDDPLRKDRSLKGTQTRTDRTSGQV